MKSSFKNLIILFLLFSCKNDENKVVTISKTEQKSVVKNDTIKEVALWSDSFIVIYLEKYKNILTEESDVPITYIKSFEQRNGKNYVRVKIGRSTEQRFITDEIIYIDSSTKKIYEYHSGLDSLFVWNIIELKEKQNGIPKDGTYRYDLAFAEWGGKTLGNKVLVKVQGNFIKILFEEGNLSEAKKGDVIEQGWVIKHKTGNWIIFNQSYQIKSEEVGGCSDGPTIIDFKNKKYWTC
jgi:hypothetical protein